MKLNLNRIRNYCRQRGRTLSDTLRDAGVSRTAYYSLARRTSVLPRSIHALADALGVGVEDILEESHVTTDATAARLVDEAAAIVEKYSQASFENVWHTVMLLREPPAERLERSLRRGRAVAVHR